MRKKYLILPIILIQLILVLISSIESKDDDDYEYLIVTTDVLKDGWTEFVEFNQRRCLRTKVQTMDYIKANMQGVDDADKLRNYIKQEFSDHNIVYVLLGGDEKTSNENEIPARMFRAQFYDNIYSPDYYQDKAVAADMYYSCLDGDWKDTNTYYGEPGSEDMYWEVYASRLPPDSPTELNNVLNKIIKYSEQPVLDQTKNNLLVGNFLWGDSLSEIWGGDYCDQFMDTCNDSGYTTKGFPSYEWTTARLYDKNSQWNSEQFVGFVEFSKPTWIDFVGHGNTTYAFKQNNNMVTNSNYTNDGTNANYYLIYAQAGNCGNFAASTDCILEQFITISNGAVACIGCSELCMGDIDGTDGPVQRVQRYFHDAIFNKRIHYLEMMNAYSKEINAPIVLHPDISTAPYLGAIRCAVYEINVLGDPALSVWTDTPKELTQPFEYHAYHDTFTMLTPPFTWVALADNSSGEIFSTQLTGFDATSDNSFDPEDSICKITDDAYKDYVASNPVMTVYIKAHNYIANSFDVQCNPGIINFNEKVIKQYSVKSIKGNVLINFALMSNEFIDISVYNSKGTLIKNLLNKNQHAGKHMVTFRSDNLSNGIYYIKLSINKNAVVKKVVVIK